ncbi:MAG: DUF1269 domain-containing protein [Actinobacteria bacterium]|nr:DUF1269 domain-containing protein [Actinomycetota bacterium]MCB8997963.1 DUF1269 domain-containing protein [Actinomycetota bacterium]MCB9414440.1 DUF1269 domain-containing protein [Actinomycetota bacterium]MCB9424725.1 DUF1269 domain-containing protein [Actinomycetota bacterium]HRY08700.1 DUF6325 family protein [Candidatus Nanopelagicales bacterium]
MTEETTDEVQLGPIDYLVVEYPDGNPTGEALPHLIDLVDRGIVRILDVAIIAKSVDGDVAVIDLNDIQEAVAGDLAVFAGASTGILDDEDIAETASIMTPGAIGAILVYENTWAAPFATALRKAGADLIANGRIPINAIIAALETQEEENA